MENKDDDDQLPLIIKQEEIQRLPPGFRFHPSDEELIVHYLSKKVTQIPLPAPIIAEVELYKFNPWDLPKKAVFGEEEWYFFTPRDRKYPNGMRPNRVASSGYWKATGTDKPILSCNSTSNTAAAKLIGVKKALVFYTGRPPKGNKTDWIMHEYRLPPTAPLLLTSNFTPTTKKLERSMRLDEWVLCRVRQKTGMRGNFWEDRNGHYAIISKETVLDQCHHVPGAKLDKCSLSPMETTTPASVIAPNPNNAVRHLLYKDRPMLPFLFGSQEFTAVNNCIIMDNASNISLEGNNRKASTSPQTGMDIISTTTVSSNISFEGNKTSSSSFCGDNFNMTSTPTDYFQNNALHLVHPPPPPPSNINGFSHLRKGNDDHGDINLSQRNSDIGFMALLHPAHNHKKQCTSSRQFGAGGSCQLRDDDHDQLPQSRSNDTTGTVVSCSTTNYMDKYGSNRPDQLSSAAMMQYQDLYDYLVFARGE